MVPVGEVPPDPKNCISDPFFRLHQRHDGFKFLLSYVFLLFIKKNWAYEFLLNVCKKNLLVPLA